MSYRPGLASGWSTYQVPGAGHWQWSAYGPNGGDTGTAQSREAAREAAQRSADNLSRPRKVED